ncbi:hypothetical protein CEXT_345231 [Caerostris extrusa]|uniref:Uncharacterized protein n=1 Tax=Caerostris extrusa TaxID=172846 RepID=A0AAV4Y1B7_CAEEX|nr:hypothetical protein CEXT_345231 [Caerostris extrusa]
MRTHKRLHKSQANVPLQHFSACCESTHVMLKMQDFSACLAWQRKLIISPCRGKFVIWRRGVPFRSNRCERGEVQRYDSACYHTKQQKLVHVERATYYRDTIFVSQR